VRRARRNFAYLSAFGMDLSLGAGMVAFNYLAKKKYGAEPWQLGLLALISAGVYVGSSLLLGRLSDRCGRRPCIVAGCLLGAAAFGLGALVRDLWHIYVLMGISATAMGAFWPALEADISDNSGPRELPGRVGRFNVAWCAGFAVTGFSAGALCQLIGHRKVLLMAAGIILLVIVVHLLRTFESEEPALPEPADCRQRASPGRAAAFWKMALVLNFAAMGANSLLRYHVPTVTGGERSALGGTYLTILFTAETLTFILLGRWHGWHHRGWPLTLSCFLVAAGGLLCGLGAQWVWVFAAGCALTGIGCGLIYNSSIYYSVAAESARGRRGGIHESALGMGAAVVPFAGGMVALAPCMQASEQLTKGAPFLAGVCFVLLAALVAALIYVRRRKSPSAEPEARDPT
jgi:MFS family permease